MLRCFCPVWVLVQVFQKMQKISTLGRLSVLMIKIRKSVEKDWKSFDFQSKSFGGDKRDRTADLMTASHALSQLSYTPIGGIILSDLFGNCKCFFRKSEKICANVWESCTVSRFEQLENVGLGGKQSVKIRFGVFRADEQMRCFGSGGIRCGNRGSRRVEGAVAVGSLCIGG